MNSRYKLCIVCDVYMCDSIDIVLWIIYRLYYFNVCCYECFMNGYDEWPQHIQNILMAYFIILSSFNFVVAFVLAERLYRYMNPKEDIEPISAGSIRKFGKSLEQVKDD